MTRTRSLLGLLVLPCLLTGCDQREANAPTGNNATTRLKPEVFAVNFPLASFAEAVGGNLIDVKTPRLDGAPITSFSPSPEEIIKIQDADLILLNGADFSPWTQHASLPVSKTITTARPFKSRWIESTHSHDHDHDHQHGPEGDGVHHHAHWASFTWLDPTNAYEQAKVVGDRIRTLLGSPDEAYQRQVALTKRLDNLIAIGKRIRALDPPTMIASEPQYQYLAAGCGIEVLDADWHWNEPTPHDGMDSLRDLVTASGANLILVPSEPDAERRAVLEEMGLEPVVFRLLADPAEAEGESFADCFEADLKNLEAICGGQSAE